MEVFGSCTIWGFLAPIPFKMQNSKPTSNTNITIIIVSNAVVKILEVRVFVLYSSVLSVWTTVSRCLAGREHCAGKCR